MDSTLIARWDIQGRKRWGREARNLHPSAGQVWLGLHLDGGGGWPVLAESEAQRLLAQVFSFKPLSLSFCLASYLSVLAHGHIQATCSSCCFLGGCTNCIQSVFCGRRWNAWRPMASNKWGLWWTRACMTSSEGAWHCQSLPHLLSHLHPRGAGRCLLLWSHAQQPKRPKLPQLFPNPKGVTYSLPWHP